MGTGPWTKYAAKQSNAPASEASKRLVRINGAPPGMNGTSDSAWNDYEANFKYNSPYATPGPYVTKLNPAEDGAFNKWVKTNRIAWQDAPNADYDMRGFWKAMISGNPNAREAWNAESKSWHFPDTWKTPYDATFSRESMYAKPSAPYWEGNNLIEERPVAAGEYQATEDKTEGDNSKK